MSPQATSRAWLVYLAGMAVVTVAYLIGPDALNVGPVYNAIGASAAIALLVGSARHRPSRPRAWRLLALGQACFVAGDVLAYNYTRFFGGDLPFPSVADLAYLSVYPALVAGLVLLVRERDQGRDRSSLTDALIVTIGLATVSWVYLMAPYVRDTSSPLATKLISIGYPVGDLLVLCVMVRLAVGRGRRGTAFKLLAAGMAALMATDTVYGWLLLHGGYETGGLLDGGWAAFYALLGAAGLHPSMRELSEAAPSGHKPLTRRRLAILAAATLLAPGVLGLQLLRGEDVDVGVVTGAAAVLFVLVVARMAGIVRHHEAAVRREAALRLASEALVSAAGRDAIAEAATEAAESLATGASCARLLLVEGAVMRVASATDGATADLHVAELAPEDRDDLRRGRTVTLTDGSQDLPPGTCLAPLLLRDELLGLLLVAPGAEAPPVPAESLGTLAAQVALALEGAALTEDLVRRQAAAHLSSLVQHSSDVVCVVGLDGTIRYASPSTERVLGHPAATFTGQPIAAFVHADDSARLPGFLQGIARRAPSAPSATELLMRHADGSWRHMEALATNLVDDPNVGGIVLNARDVSDRKAFEAQLAHQAFHDTLTGLPNRALFRDRVTQALARQARAGGRLAVLFIDVDDFKTVNDSLGHAAGDDLLREVAHRVSGEVRRTDTTARLGGDEFAVLVDAAADDVEIVRVAERMLRVLYEPVQLEGRDITLRASIGLAFAGDAGAEAVDAEDLLRNADAAMYVAKAQGKGRYQLFEPEMHATALTRLELKTDLQRAVDAREFSLRYQPIVELATGRMSGLEALVRWEHPDRGVVSPADFIPLAEDTGLIVPLGRQILLDACRQAAVFHAAGHPELTVSVNVSARQLQPPEFVDEVRHALEVSGIPPARLVIELTESVMIEDTELAVLRLHDLHELGVQLAIDDFGTGYSSLNYLRQFPIDILKIDQSFVRGAHEDPEVLALTHALLELARVLDLRPVAEGVEVPEELALLRDMGCAYGQGYLFARPLPAGELLELLGGSGDATTFAAVA